MSENGNGTTAPEKRLLSLDQARANKQRKGNDFITVQQAYDMVIQECAKVHEHYLEQIPTFTARLVQDALLHYQLIKPIEPVDIPTASGYIVGEAQTVIEPPADAPTVEGTVTDVGNGEITVTFPPAEPAS